MYPNYMGQTMPPYTGSNPYLERLNAIQQPSLPKYEIIHVNGSNGVDAFRMAPNSQCLLLDDTAPIVWLVTTDGAGYPSKTPYTITPYQAKPEPDFNNMNERLAKLEALIYGTKSDATAVKPEQTAEPHEHDSAVPAVR